VLKQENNYAFIDSQNVHLGIKALGWDLDWKKFRVYLREKCSVQKAYVFIGMVTAKDDLYKYLQECGFILIFKPTVADPDGKIKGNCDADLVLHTMLEKENFDKAVIISSDGDFYSLVRHLYQNKKLLFVFSPYIKTCSQLLKKEAKEKIYSMSNLKNKLSRSK
jgi:uncharacterized LabA/DUF88 family protein